MQEKERHSATPEVELVQLVERASLCLPDFHKDSIAHRGDENFPTVLKQYYETTESNAAERLIELKNNLRAASTHDFWTILMKEMCTIMNAQCGFVAKRILVDVENTAVEMPPLGEPGSCLLGVGFYLNNGEGLEQMHHDYKYHAYGSPCAHMRHDKVFVIPERLHEVIPNNPNVLPWEKSEAFIGVPLFSEGKCFAHFGMTWSTKGAAKKKLSWMYIEMFMHSLEDMITQRLLEGKGFAKEAVHATSIPAKIIPLDAITASQSLKPYARSLSHELRTPMQGVVGMLEIMHSTVMDAMDSQKHEKVRQVFEELRSNIETVQDSSRRAVEAADNVVHAYDLNMQMPDTPLTTADDETQTESSLMETPGHLSRPSSRLKRLRSDEQDFHPGPPLKRFARTTKAELQYGQEKAADNTAEIDFAISQTNLSVPSSKGSSNPTTPTTALNPVQHHIPMRDFMHSLVNEVVQSFHPVKITNNPTELGEVINVCMAGPRGESLDITIHLVTESNVPEIINVEEKHLHFALQKVVDNAVKFTDSGNNTITVKVARNAQLVEIRVVDTGCGINDESKAFLFQPHFQEDATISRSRDGLGLSLFNAKAHVRKNLGGDMTLERSATEGPSKGSEFLIRLPISTVSGNSRPDIPLVGAIIPSSSPHHSRPNSPRPTLSTRSSSSNSTTSTGPIPNIHHSPPRSKSSRTPSFSRNLAASIPLNFLVAEDNVINRNIIVGYLKKLGYELSNIILAFDGVEAVRQYEESLARPPGQQIDAILMDLWMPNMDGYQATDRILALAKQRGDNLKVMAVTADITSESLEKAKQTGMKGFLAKPYKVLDVQHLIVEHFGMGI